MTGDIPPAQAVLEQIPEPDTCRAMLARAAREIELLRWLLKVSQRKADLRGRSAPVEVPPCSRAS
jgi:hypothetical protein